MTTINPDTVQSTVSSPWRRRALMVVAAVAAATALGMLAQVLGIKLQVSMPGQVPMVVSLPFVLATSLAASLAGWGALALLERVTRQARTVWTVLAVAALLASFGPVASVHTTAGARITLGLMHLAVAAVLIPGLRATPTRPADGPSRKEQS